MLCERNFLTVYTPEFHLICSFHMMHFIFTHSVAAAPYHVRSEMPTNNETFVYAVLGHLRVSGGSPQDASRARFCKSWRLAVSDFDCSVALASTLKWLVICERRLHVSNPNENLCINIVISSSFIHPM